ncbi:MAG: hypothetical protein ACK449_03790 [Planctomycetota bacterium]
MTSRLPQASEITRSAVDSTNHRLDRGKPSMARCLSLRHSAVFVDLFDRRGTFESAREQDLAE